jgi:peptidyl-prolyl cis-trans isomerase A (cyclophilin A)
MGLFSSINNNFNRVKFYKPILFCFVAILFFSCTKKKYKYPRIEIETKYGLIVAELYTDRAPKTCAAILSYVDSGFYQDASFYRVLNVTNQPSNAPKTEILQGGLWKTNYLKLYEMKGIPHEPTSKTGLKHTDGVLSLARNKPGTANAEFFICIGNQPGLDQGGENVEDKLGYAAFGKVIKGMSVVRKIYMLNDHEQMLTPPVAIYNITQK